MTTTTEPEFYGNYDFVASVDEEGNPCVREYGTPNMYTPGEQWGHAWDSAKEQRYAAPCIQDMDAYAADRMIRRWVAEAREACAHFRIA